VDCVIEEIRLPIQRIRTVRRGEFFAVKVQERLKECGIKFQPFEHASPTLNGRAEQHTICTAKPM
jgi:hypothetical protein